MIGGGVNVHVVGAEIGIWKVIVVDVVFSHRKKETVREIEQD